MQDEIAARGQQIGMPAQDFAHAALDAISFMGLAEHFACGQTDSRPDGLLR